MTALAVLCVPPWHWSLPTGASEATNGCIGSRVVVLTNSTNGCFYAKLTFDSAWECGGWHTSLHLVCSPHLSSAISESGITTAGAQVAEVSGHFICGCSCMQRTKRLALEAVLHVCGWLHLSWVPDVLLIRHIPLLTTDLGLNEATCWGQACIWSCLGWALLWPSVVPRDQQLQQAWCLCLAMCAWLKELQPFVRSFNVLAHQLQ